MQLSVIVPVFNEEENIAPLLDRLKSVVEEITPDFEVIFINDGSKDGTLMKVKQAGEADPRVKYIDLSRNFGHQEAVTAGLNFARGKAVVIIDADLQDPPELIPAMFDRWEEGYKVVYAKRESRSGESWFKLKTAKIFYRLLQRITRYDIPVDTGDFRLIDRKVVDLLNDMGEHSKFLRGQIAWMGFEQTSVSYNRDPRAHGSTGYSLSKMVRLALNGITGFSDLPLRLVTIFGFLASVVAVLVMIYSFYSQYVLKDTVPGWASIMVSLLFLGGLQMIALGIIGEYLSRIYDEVRERPPYIIRQHNFDED
jgi:dolichol-phosphate mannosyltransferase